MERQIARWWEPMRFGPPPFRRRMWRRAYWRRPIGLGWRWRRGYPCGCLTLTIAGLLGSTLSIMLLARVVALIR